MAEMFIKENWIDAAPSELNQEVFRRCNLFEGDDEQLKVIANLLDLGADINHQEVLLDYWITLLDNLFDNFIYFFLFRVRTTSQL